VKIFFQKSIFFEKNFKKIYLSKMICEKKISGKNFAKFILPTLVEISSNGLKLEETEIFLLQ